MFRKEYLQYQKFIRTKNRFTNPATVDFIHEIHEEFDACNREISQNPDRFRRHRLTEGAFFNNLPDDYDVLNGSVREIVRIIREIQANHPRSGGVYALFQMVMAYLMEHHAVGLEGFDGSPFERDCFLFLAEKRDFARAFIEVVESGVPVRRVRLTTLKKAPASREFTHVIFFDMEDELCQNLLLESIATVSKKQYYRSEEAPFYEKFGESLGFDSPSSVSGFNVTTLMRQYDFFRNEDQRLQTFLRFFYIFLMTRQGEHADISIRDGITVEYLRDSRFFSMYEDGYRAVLLNPNEPVPSYDRWMTVPNGLELKSAGAKSYELRPVDFLRFKDPAIRQAAKEWYWNVSQTNLKYRRVKVNILSEFFEFRQNLRDHHLLDFVKLRGGNPDAIQNTIIAEEVAGFMVQSQSISTSYRGARGTTLREFFRYLLETGAYAVEKAVFPYLRTGGSHHRKNKVEPLSKEEVATLFSALENVRGERLSYELYYIIFCLNILTPLRITSILDLDTDCIIEKAQPGVYAIRARVKTSEGEMQDYQIYPNMVRLVRHAVEITQPLRDGAPEQAKHFLFLSHRNRFEYKAVNDCSYRTFLQKISKESGIHRNVTPEVLRKTYMTEVVQDAIDNHISLMNLRALTGHASFDTTSQYYVNENIRRYLEEMNGVQIGNMPVRGTVDAAYEGADESTVEEGCGYCRNPDCNVEGTANCLMCPGFVTTPEHIGEFEEAIANLDKKIIQTEEAHDKDHLYQVKRLYVAYLERMYAAKEGEHHDEVD